MCFDVIRRVLRDVFRLDSTLVMVGRRRSCSWLRFTEAGSQGITDVDDKIIDRARQAGHQSIEDVCGSLSSGERWQGDADWRAGLARI